MNTLVKKEVRLLLPSWLTVLLLTTILPWVWKTDGSVIIVSPVVYFFGAVLIAVGSFGREFSLGTFSLLMSQPVERRNIWRNKVAVLAVGVTIIYIVQLSSYELWLHWWLPASGSLSYIGLGEDRWKWIATTAILMFVAASGGLWTTLLLRQVAAAMWIAWLAPAALLLLMAFLLSQMFQSAPDLVAESVIIGAAGLYAVAGFCLAHRLFHHAHDVGWSGGTVSFSTWRHFDARSKASVSARRRKPIIALLKKEFQLQSISLVCAGALLVLHIGVFFLRIFLAKYDKDSLAANVSDFYCLLWLFIPLVIGCTAVAEERRLGVMEGQCCLPVSRRVQFSIKGLLALLLGSFFGGIMPMLLEGIATFLRVPNSEFLFNNRSEVGIPGIAIIGCALGLSLVGFYASTLAKSFLQAVGIAVVAIIGCILFAALAGNLHSFMGVTWNPDLTICISILTTLVMLLWLTYSNFKYFQEWRRVWQRNIFGITGAMFLTFVSSAALYNRIWEVFEPTESRHGTPILSLSDPPALQGGFHRNLLLRLPDGRVWFDSLGQEFYSGSLPRRWKELRWLFIRPLLRSTGPRQFIAGSNWVSVTASHVDFGDGARGSAWRGAGYLDTIGIQSDGTLWISSEAKPIVWTGARMIRFGEETNWQQVVRSGFGLLLLKVDGTLWLWGTNSLDWSQWQTNWPSLRASKPKQFGTDSDWKEVVNERAGYVRRAGGSIWAVWRDSKTGKDVQVRRADLDQIVPETFSWVNDNSMGYVAKDGTLWIGEHYIDREHDWEKETGKFLQASKETNWVTVAMNWYGMVALKDDGSLWKWDFPKKSNMGVAKISPIRLGIHSDWVALTSTWGGAISLAADGSLWFWPSAGYYEGTLLKIPKQPQSLGNIFSDTH